MEISTLLVQKNVLCKHEESNTTKDVLKAFVGPFAVSQLYDMHRIHYCGSLVLTSLLYH
jgi:hypothetical protein